MGTCLSKKPTKSGKDIEVATVKPLGETEKAVLLANTNFSVREIEEWHAGFLRDCPSGRLNKKQFVKEYRKFYPSGEPEEFCEHVFRIFDADQNGFIDFQEFLMSINLTSTNKNYKKKLQWIFKLYDIDSNGRIDFDEFRKIVLSIFKILDKNNNSSGYTDKFRDQHIRDLFTKIDADKSKYITLDEFVDACCRDQLLLELLAPSA